MAAETGSVVEAIERRSFEQIPRRKNRMTLGQPKWQAKQCLVFCGRASYPALGQLLAEVAADEVVVQINVDNFGMWVAC